MTTKGLMLIARKHCHNWKVCEAQKGCCPVPCKYYREVVLPTCMRHIQWKHKKEWSTSKDFTHFINARQYLMAERKKSQES